MLGQDARNYKNDRHSRSAVSASRPAQQEHEQPDESAGGVSGCEGVEEGNGGAREQPGQQQLAGQSGAPGF